MVSVIGQDVLAAMGTSQASDALPTTLTAFWELLRGSVTLIEVVTAAVFSSDFNQWQTWLFIYLIVCLTVRMAPLPGTQRGAVGAILLLGLIAAVVSMITTAQENPEQTIQSIWSIVSLILNVYMPSSGAGWN